jgi:hypothetical protein
MDRTVVKILDLICPLEAYVNQQWMTEAAFLHSAEAEGWRLKDIWQQNFWPNTKAEAECWIFFLMS